MSTVENQPNLCPQCGQPTDGGAFCPHCGAKTTVVSDPANLQTQAKEGAQPPAKRKKRKPLIIALCFVGAVVLIAAILALVFYLKFWPGKFTSEQLSQIQSNAEDRMEFVLREFDYDNVDFKVTIEDEVEKASTAEPLWLRRIYTIQYNISTDGILEEIDKACIAMLMEWFWGGKILLDGSVINGNSGSPDDLNAYNTNHFGALSDKTGNTIMGVYIPATDYSWQAHTRITIDGEFFIASLSRDNYSIRCFGSGDEYTVEDPLLHIDSRS